MIVLKFINANYDESSSLVTSRGTKYCGQRENIRVCCSFAWLRGRLMVWDSSALDYNDMFTYCVIVFVVAPCVQQKVMIAQYNWQWGVDDPNYEGEGGSVEVWVGR